MPSDQWHQQGHHTPHGTGRGGGGRGTQNVQNTENVCGFLQTGFYSSERMQYSRFLLWALGVTSLIITGGPQITHHWGRGPIGYVCHCFKYIALASYTHIISWTNDMSLSNSQRNKQYWNGLKFSIINLTLKQV